MDQPNATQSTIIAVALIALVGVMFWRATGTTADADVFAAVWAGAGTLVGVLTGAVPSFFFRAQANAEKARADTERQHTAEATDKAMQLVPLVADEHRATAQRIVGTPVAG
jgi:hypothetical protein